MIALLIPAAFCYLTLFYLLSLAYFAWIGLRFIALVARTAWFVLIPATVFTYLYIAVLGRFHVSVTPASVNVAESLLSAFLQCKEVGQGWRRDSKQASLLQGLRSEIVWLDQDLPRAVGFARVPFAVQAAAIEKYRQAAQFLQHIAVRISDARSADEFAAIMAEFRHRMVNVANGDWQDFVDPVGIEREPLLRRSAIPRRARRLGTVHTVSA